MTKVDQVCIGSCTNSSYTDLMTVAAMLKGKTVSPEVSLAIAPGSRQVLSMLSENGALTTDLSMPEHSILKVPAAPSAWTEPQFRGCFSSYIQPETSKDAAAHGMPEFTWSVRKLPLQAA